MVTMSSGFFRQGEDLSNLSNLDLRHYFLRIFENISSCSELKKRDRVPLFLLHVFS